MKTDDLDWKKKDSLLLSRLSPEAYARIWYCDTQEKEKTKVLMQGILNGKEIEKKMVDLEQEQAERRKVILKR